ncbi:hypothetical protein Daesc_004229 [Daldinia eschscholtzii]|uniref:HNH nuclease domain-containing protein n=1 Tax=Daldinia eschscholtzii TaxID=292717 RepID=A0AAX6MQ12_9PEZI
MSESGGFPVPTRPKGPAAIGTSEGASVTDTPQYSRAVDFAPIISTADRPTTPLASLMLPFRPPSPVPFTRLDIRLAKMVEICHPNYGSDSPMILLRTADGGVQYLIAYYACCIVANNVWQEDEGRDLQNADGPFLSTSKDPSDRITIPSDDLLPAGRYFFHVPSFPNGDYPIVPTFDDWELPAEIPLPWRAVESPYKRPGKEPPPNMARIPSRCYITDYDDGVQSAFIIPRTEARWSTRNLSNVTFDCCSPNEWRNKIPLRKDLHDLWNRCFLTLVPKPVLNKEKTYKLVTHFTLRGYPFPSKETFALYHNRIIPDLGDVPACILFARFAWSIFNFGTLALFERGQEYYVYALVKKVKKKRGGWERKYLMLSESEIRKRFRDEKLPDSVKIHGSNKRRREEEDDDGCSTSDDTIRDQYYSPTDSESSEY